MRNCHKDKGFTLIEVVISLAILGIIVVSFLSLFTSGYKTIFTMGSKTKAIAEAQKYIDGIYKSGDVSDAGVQAILATPDFEKKNNYSDLISTPNTSNKRIRYSVETTNISGEVRDLVSIQVYYQNGEKSVTLTSVIP